MILLALFLGVAARADDQPLSRLRAALLPLRHAGAPVDGKLVRAGAPSTELRGATPALTAAKHALKDWVESRMADLGGLGDEKALATQLNTELRKADLFCETSAENSPDRCAAERGEWNGIGYLVPIELDRQELGEILVLHTGVGIYCGRDESAYAYEYQRNKWQRFWQSEQGIQPGTNYTPQTIDAIDMSRPDQKTHERLILSLGNERWCSSNFYRVYFRIWRSESGNDAARPLLDQLQFAYLGEDPPITGSIGSNDALIEFRATSLDVGVHSYETVRHYSIEGKKIARIDPFALGPRAFVEDWLKADWAESARWQIPHSLTNLQAWHRKLHADYLSGAYLGDTQRCGGTPDLHQVGIGFGHFDQPKRNVYFRMSWTPPYNFEMIDISAMPHTNCNESDKDADSEHTLFPIQPWR